MKKIKRKKNKFSTIAAKTQQGHDEWNLKNRKYRHFPGEQGPHILSGYAYGQAFSPAFRILLFEYLLLHDRDIFLSARVNKIWNVENFCWQ